MLRNSSLIFYPQEEFNQIFRHFATSFATDENSKNTSGTLQLFSYYQNFVEHEEYSSIGFPELEQTCEGYLHLELVTNNNTGHQLDKIQIDKQQLYILSATYLSPFAQNLVQDNKINGIQLDTTWSILKNYVTSIPTLICQNVGIPIGFQIGLHEDTSIYTDFFENFENCFGFRINDYIKIAQSDQGRSLSAAIGERCMQYICCLRHLLVSLGKTKFSSQIGKLVTAPNIREYEKLKSIYESSWCQLSKSDMDLLKADLKKVGLTFSRRKIKVSDGERWLEVAMQFRPAYKMPTCTNQLESAHGHMNRVTPRRNTFFASLKRIIDEIIRRTLNFEKKL